jgi:putative lipoic acid-binding regulatory protein
MGVVDPDNRRTRALALLESQHAFPGPFEFRVVVRPEAGPAALDALLLAAGGRDRLIDVSERTSEHGNYRSLRVRVQLERAAEVLDGYEVLRAVDGVVTVL